MYNIEGNAFTLSYVGVYLNYEWGRIYILQEAHVKYLAL